MNKNLVVLRCGKSSLHNEWVKSHNRNWDLVLCPYQDIDECEFPKFFAHGQKWIGLKKFFEETNNWKNYEFIWLPDDDIETNTDTINKMFDNCHIYRPHLAAPALSDSSYYSHFITMVNKNFQWRRTSFVEIMFPCISSYFMKEVIKSFELTKTGTGFGLDFLWPALLKYENIMIFDNVQMRHTRPIGGFRSKELGDQAMDELYFVNAGLGIPQVYKTFEGCTNDGTNLQSDHPVFSEKYTDGYNYLNSDSTSLFKFIQNLQSFEPKNHHFSGIFKTIDFCKTKRVQACQSVSLNKPSLSSSVSKYSRSQDRSIDAKGGNDGLFNGHCRFHTEFESDPWWQVDLLAVYNIERVEVYNRLDFKSRCVKFIILSSNDGLSWKLVGAKLDSDQFGGIDGYPYILSFSEKVCGRYVRLQMVGSGYLHLDQVEVFGKVLNEYDQNVVLKNEINV